MCYERMYEYLVVYLGIYIIYNEIIYNIELYMYSEVVYIYTEIGYWILDIG